MGYYENDDSDRKLEESSTSRNEESDKDSSGCDKLIGTLNIDDECESTTHHSEEDDDSFGKLPTIGNKVNGRMGMNNRRQRPGIGPGSSMLRQASRKTVWGK